MQSWDADGYQRNAGFVPALAGAVVDLLAPAEGERILDLGCGDGVLTEKLQDTGAWVVGVDASAEMVAAACARGLDARVMDGAALDFPEPFDAVFSNAALHWMPDAAGVIAAVHRALKPGGRFVAEFGGFGNVAAIVTALTAVLSRRGIDATARHPWFFPTADQYRALLTQGGFTVEDIHLFPRPTPLPTGMAGWLETFARPFLQDMEAAEASTVLREAEDLLRPALCDAGGQWWADYVRLRFRAHR